MTQPSLLDDPTLAERLREKAQAGAAAEAGIKKAQKKLLDEAGRLWRDTALAMLERVARLQPELTSDDVWAALEQHAIEQAIDGGTYSSQMGIIFRLGQKARLIKSTGRFIESRRASRHRSGIRVWDSLVYRRG